MNLLDLFEARTPLYDILEPLRDDPTAFISFQGILKLGVYPKTEWDTPMGVYAYPVSEMFTRYSRGNVPFAGDRRYAFVMKAEGEICELQTIAEDYVEADFQRITRKYREMFYAASPSDPHSTREENIEFFESMYMDWVSRYAYHPGMSLWRVTERMAAFIENRFPNRSRGMIWNSLLRTCGYDVVVDREEGIISSNEPAQAVFLQNSAYRVLTAAPNDLFRPLSSDFSRRGRSEGQ